MKYDIKLVYANTRAKIGRVEAESIDAALRKAEELGLFSWKEDDDWLDIVAEPANEETKKNTGDPPILPALDSEIEIVTNVQYGGARIIISVPPGSRTHQSLGKLIESVLNGNGPPLFVWRTEIAK